MARWDTEYKWVGKHTLSIRTSCQGCACQMPGPSSLPVSTAAAASKQAGQVLLRLEQHQGLICVYSTQHLQHSEFHTRWKPWRWTVTSVRIKKWRSRNGALMFLWSISWGRSIWKINLMTWFLIYPLYPPNCSDQPAFTVALCLALLWVFMSSFADNKLFTWMMLLNALQWKHKCHQCCATPTVFAGEVELQRRCVSRSCSAIAQR